RRREVGQQRFRLRRDQARGDLVIGEGSASERVVQWGPQRGKVAVAHGQRRLRKIGDTWEQVPNGAIGAVEEQSIFGDRSGEIRSELIEMGGSPRLSRRVQQKRIR